jgi:hypothetical protein
MLTLWGARRHFCDRLTRRSFLAIGAFGAGLSLVNLLRARAAGGNATRVRARSEKPQVHPSPCGIAPIWPAS